MTMPLSVINDHARIESVYNESEEYLNAHLDLRNRIAAHLWAYNEVGDLVPQTLPKFSSGHFFPYLESHYELECSFELCNQGFYRHSFFALRSALELAVLGLYYDKDDQAETDIQKWLHSDQDTPRFTALLAGLFKSDRFREFDGQFGLREAVKELYSGQGGLSDHVHVRGYNYSSHAHFRANFNRFNESSLRRYVQFMERVVKAVIAMMMLKYPIGMQRLPLFAKYGFNPPAGGFLDEDSQPVVVAVLDEAVREALQQLSDNDPDVHETVRSIIALPDLTAEQLAAQSSQTSKWDGG
jgi:hypothetical protein